MDERKPVSNPNQLQITLLELDFKQAEETGFARPGGTCPHCNQGTLDYDGMLELRCPACGYAEGGCFT